MKLRLCKPSGVKTLVCPDTLSYTAVYPMFYLARLEYCLGLGDVWRRLECHVLLALAVEHAEEVVVRAGHDVGVAAVPTALELVEDVVVLVQ